MRELKLAVIYDSKTGNTQKAAEWIAEGMREMEDVESRTFHINSVDEDFVMESKGVVIGSPSYAALMTPGMRNWLMTSASKLKLAGKLGGAFATEQYTHGGGDLVIQSIMTNELVMGMLCYSGGNAYGKPVIHIGPVGVNDNLEPHNGMEKYHDYFCIFGHRFAEMAGNLL